MPNSGDSVIEVWANESSIVAIYDPGMVNILEVAAQGPKGATGPQGVSPAASAVCGVNISGGSLVVMINGLLYPADPTDITQAESVVGIAMTAGLAGASIQYTDDGEIDGEGPFVQGSRYYAGLNGSLSTARTAPGAAWIKGVGIAKTTSALVISLQPSIGLST